MSAAGIKGLPGLALAHIIYGIPITTLTFRNYYAALPQELLEAAQIDGSTMLGIYRHILLPISLPSFVVVTIWQFTSAWNDFLFAVILTGNKTGRSRSRSTTWLAVRSSPGTCRWRDRF